MWKALCVLALLAFASLAFAQESIQGSKLIDAQITSEDEIKVISSWDLDVWSYDSRLIIGSNHIRVSEEQLIALEELGIKYEVMVKDVLAMVEDLAKDYKNETAADWFASYHTLDEFNAYFTNLTTNYPTLIKKTTIGQSVQGRNIDAYILTGTATGNKKKIVWTGMQHAREWISPATVAYQMTQLLTLYANPSVKRLMDNIQFHVIPIVNPDGYLYTWGGSSQRLWRKNRRANTGGSYGVDLNRNWDDHWGGDGSSKTPTSDTYCGTAPFSEPETKAVSNYITANGPFAGYIDFHSYSQLVLRNYGWTRTAPPDSAVQKLVGDGMSSAIRAVHGKSYTSEPSYTLYTTTGTSDDWAYITAKIIYTYCIELRDTGSYGFQLPANQIIPTGQEIWGAMQYFADYIIKL